MKWCLNLLCIIIWIGLMVTLVGALPQPVAIDLPKGTTQPVQGGYGGIVSGPVMHQISVPDVTPPAKPFGLQAITPPVKGIMEESEKYTLSSLGSANITISPDVLHLNQGISIDYTGFSDGLAFTADIEFSYTPKESGSSGIVDGIFLHPFQLHEARITATEGSLFVNEKPVPSGVFSGQLTDGMFLLKVTDQVTKPGVVRNVSFRIQGVKTAGEPDGSISFSPDLSPKEGKMVITCSIGNSTFSKVVEVLPSVSDDYSISVSEEKPDDEHGYMRLTEEDIREINRQQLLLETAPNEQKMIVQGSRNLLSRVPGPRSERNQGQCGNCWVWASTGVVEVTHSVQRSVNNRLSIQYLNSNYNGGSGTNIACSGGWPSNYAGFYNTAPHKRLIPWSNRNANYYDGTCNYDAGCRQTKMPAYQITTTPNYPLTSMTAYTIPTYSVSNSQAINNIKAELNANRAVVYSYFTTQSDWSTYWNPFWSSQSASALFNPTVSAGKSGDLSGHAVVLVGYNDDSSNRANWYWLLLNSWGTRSNRPDGTFRVKMDVNYGAWVGGNYCQYFHRVTPVFGSTPPGGSQDKIGVVRRGSSQSQWILANADGSVYQRFNYGLRTDWPISGDWNGDGRDNIGVERWDGQYTRWVLATSSGSVYQRYYMTGRAAWTVSGDWNGDGRDTLGVVLTSGNQLRFLLINFDGTTYKQFNYGNWRTDIPVAGDWNGDGRDTVGVARRGSTQTQWILANTDGSVYRRFNYGTRTDWPFTGDWNGDGRDTIGVVRRGSTQSQWILANADGSVYRRFNYGTRTDIPITGDWSGVRGAGGVENGSTESIEIKLGTGVQSYIPDGNLPGLDVPRFSQLAEAPLITEASSVAEMPVMISPGVTPITGGMTSEQNPVLRIPEKGVNILERGVL